MSAFIPPCQETWEELLLKNTQLIQENYRLKGLIAALIADIEEFKKECKIPIIPSTARTAGSWLRRSEKDQGKITAPIET